MRNLVLIGVLGWLGGCSGKADNVLAGKWLEDAAGAGNMDVEFDGRSDRFQLCNEAGGEGKQGHDHLVGTFLLVDGKVTLTGAWESNRKTETVTGALQGDRLTLDLHDGKKVFRRQ